VRWKLYRTVLKSVPEATTHLNEGMVCVKMIMQLLYTKAALLPRKI